MILRITEQAIQPLIHAAIDEALNARNAIPVLLSDEESVKPQMPYVVVRCLSCSEEIAPGSGIFNVSGEICFRSHIKETSSEFRAEVLDAINNFAYDQTATKLSLTDGFHCYGWQPTTGEMQVEADSKSYLYMMKYAIHCMARNNT